MARGRKKKSEEPELDLETEAAEDLGAPADESDAEEVSEEKSEKKPKAKKASSDLQKIPKKFHKYL